MATVDDVEVANASFPNVRQDLNDILEAITTNFSADTEPTTTYPNQFWYETDTNLLYIRNEADDDWITLASINQTTGEWEPRTAVIQAIDSAGIALKTDDGTTRFSISDAGVVSFENYSFPSADGTDGQVLTTDGAGNLTFESGGGGDKIEEGNSSVEVVDTGTGSIQFDVDGSEIARLTSGGLGINCAAPSFGSVGSGFDEDGNAFLNRNDGPAIFEFGNNGGGSNLSNGDIVGRMRFTGRHDGGFGGPEVIGDIQIRYTGNGTSRAGEIGFRPYPKGETLILDSSGNLKMDSGYGSTETAYGCRAWVHFDGTGTVAIQGDGNISSITDINPGRYNINIETAITDANFCVTLAGGRSSGSSDMRTRDDFTTTGFEIQTLDGNQTTFVDFDQVCVAIHR